MPARHPGRAGAGTAAGWDEPDDGSLPTPAENRIFLAVIRYVIAHGGTGGLSFNRIDQGAKGTQQIKRQQLDLAVRLAMIGETGQGQQRRYRYTGPAGWFSEDSSTA